MRIEVIRSVMISGEPAFAGSFVEVSPADANLLIGSNKARLAVEPVSVTDQSPICDAPKRTRKPVQPTASEEV
jgi:hypothetical protein